MQYILCLVLLFTFTSVSLACDKPEYMMPTQSDLERQMRELEADKTSLRIEPVPKEKVGEWDKAHRQIVCGELIDIMSVMTDQEAQAVFAGTTLQGEHVQLFQNQETGVWFFISAGPADGRGCSLGGGTESVTIVTEYKLHL